MALEPDFRATTQSPEHASGAVAKGTNIEIGFRPDNLTILPDNIIWSDPDYSAKKEASMLKLSISSAH